MQTVKADAEISADGSVKLLAPLPAWVKPGRVQVLVMVNDDPRQATEPKRQSPRATPAMLEARRRAMAELRAMGGLGDVIPDPVAWQREIRKDAILHGRD